jgi:hypothetical protein
VPILYGLAVAGDAGVVILVLLPRFYMQQNVSSQIGVKKSIWDGRESDKKKFNIIIF